MLNRCTQLSFGRQADALGAFPCKSTHPTIAFVSGLARWVMGCGASLNKCWWGARLCASRPCGFPRGACASGRNMAHRPPPRRSVAPPDPRGASKASCARPAAWGAHIASHRPTSRGGAQHMQIGSGRCHQVGSQGVQGRSVGAGGGLERQRLTLGQPRHAVVAQRAPGEHHVAGLRLAPDRTSQKPMNRCSSSPGGGCRAPKTCG